MNHLVFKKGNAKFQSSCDLGDFVMQFPPIITEVEFEEIKEFINMAINSLEKRMQRQNEVTPDKEPTKGKE